MATQFRYSQLRFLSLILGSWLTVFTFTRFALWLAHLPDTQSSVGSALHFFGMGLLFDLAFLTYASLPLILYLTLVPHRVWRSAPHRWWLHGLLSMSLFAMLFVAISEWLFWEEFSVRFNFIAVDYLVYSDEVINNILQSYPVYPLLACLGTIAVTVTYLLRWRTRAALQSPVLPWKYRPLIGAVALLAAGLSYGLANQSLFDHWPGTTYQKELAANGPYQFFAAFRNNKLDYQRFYAQLPGEISGNLVREELAEPNARFTGEDPRDIRRFITHPGQPHKLNVILVTVESLSAKYLGSFGHPDNLTPNLDRLRAESLFFNRFYATGTRTTRGLEAITLSVPPTPGRSIVKRIGEESGYASLGQQFIAKGYDSVFLYGGRGYFDNMNAFFRGNGYRVVDQEDIPNSKIHFENAWGVADEDLYQQAIEVANADHRAGKPFFLQLMTTSNHRPYTYPEGRIDIPSGTGREGAVKYTDYAIGEFLAKARQEKWFDKTLFVFVADHTAGSAGKEDLPVHNYHIPMFIYAPGFIAPREVSDLASQIDLAPTLLGLLNMDYVSTFFGRDLLLPGNRSHDRVLIGNYQHLGLYDGKDLAILSPRQSIRRHNNVLKNSAESTATLNDPLARRTIAFYQTASYDLKSGLLNWKNGNRPAEKLSQTTPDNGDARDG
ncbi:MAG: alkaline phosphatase family protein [Gammaproteobacteria bacterium]|nr:MAG: alkaline phosphatase family protein [Gammaproteobacteria bacterium]